VRERPNRTVSKTVVPPGTVGSNPTPSASQRHRGNFHRIEVVAYRAVANRSTTDPDNYSVVLILNDTPRATVRR